MRGFFYFRNNYQSALQILQKYWGHSNLRKQEKIINSILEKKTL